MDGQKVADALNSRNLPGVFCVEKYYKAGYKGEQDVLCDGIMILLTNKNAFRPVQFQLNLIDVLSSLYPGDFVLDAHYLAVIRMGTADVVDSVKQGKSIMWLEQKWEQESAEFELARRPYLIYE